MKVFTTSKIAAGLVVASMETPSDMEIADTMPKEKVLGTTTDITGAVKRYEEQLLEKCLTVSCCKSSLAHNEYFKEPKKKKLNKADRRRGFHLG